MIFPFLHMCGMLLWTIVWLNMYVRAPMATRPRCFNCRSDMPSGPVDPFCPVLSITVFVMLGVNKGGGSVTSLILLCVLSISLSLGLCGSRDMEEECALISFDCYLGEAWL